MRTKPAFFDQVAAESRARWDQLSADPVLAGPWRQLFKQVKSPRHVLSELLQNADDAEASVARAWLEGDWFNFEHDGRDFTDSDLDSLCRFGYSNKAHLHTIGFRGLGFKATFSLGSPVEVRTPTLAFLFNEDKFTLPIWKADAAGTTRTLIRVRLASKDLVTLVEEQFAQWSRDAVPMVFFAHLTDLTLGRRTTRRVDEGPGPVPGARRYRLEGETAQRVLVISSADIPLPSAAVAEIREERGDEGFSVPPVRVSLILGQPAAGRLYAVLPTDTQLPLPFSVNAPFVQDPARTGVKDPVVSPTNRWLLSTVGQLAAQSISAWAADLSMGLEDRASAYDLLPGSPATDSSRPETRVVTEAIAKCLSTTSVLLCTGGELGDRADTLALPAQVADIWEVPVACRLFGVDRKRVLAAEVRESARQALRAWGLLDSLSAEAILRLLEVVDPPRPALQSLVRLWAFLEPHVRAARWRSWGSLCVVPALQQETLVRASKARLPAANVPELTAEEWESLQQYAPLVDPDWPKAMGQGTDLKELSPNQQRALDLAEILGVLKPVGLSAMLQAAVESLDGRSATDDELLRLMAVAVKGNVTLPDAFPMRTLGGEIVPASSGVLSPSARWVSELLPADQAHRTLSDIYSPVSLGVAPTRWDEWMRSPDSRLLSFPKPAMSPASLWGRAKGDEWLDHRGYQGYRTYKLQSSAFLVEDYDFDEALWQHWTDLTKCAPETWVFLVQAVAEAWDAGWTTVSGGRLYQRGTVHDYPVNGSPVPARWVERLRDLPCLPDESFTPQLPATLLRRTPENDFLRDIERFVHTSFEGPGFDELLELLGAKSDPAGPDRLLSRLRALTGLSDPPRAALLDLYRALDRLASRLSTERRSELAQVFEREPLIWATDTSWQRAHDVYQAIPLGMQAALGVWSEAAALALWPRVGVASEPTRELLVDWLRSLPRDQQLRRDEAGRVRKLLGSYVSDSSDVGDCWLSCSGRWRDVSAFMWRSTVALPDCELFPSILDRLADLAMRGPPGALPAGLCHLPVLEVRLDVPQAVARWSDEDGAPAWAISMANCLCRFPEGEEGAAEAPRMGLRLARTRWHTCSVLTVKPMVEGEQAGPVFSPGAVWINDHIYVTGRPVDYHDDLVAELQRAVPSKVARAVAACAGRDADWVREYFEQHWSLLPTPRDAETTLVQAPPAGIRAEVAPIALRLAPVSPELEPQPLDHEGQRDGLPVGDGLQPDRPEPPETVHHVTGRSARQDALARALASLGFVAVGPGSYRNADEVVREDVSELFDAVWYREGLEVGWFWVGGGTLASGVVVPAEVWDHVRSEPAAHWLVLPDADSLVNARDLAQVGVEVLVSSYRLRQL